VSIRQPTKQRVMPSAEALIKAREIGSPVNVIATMATHHDRLYRYWRKFHTTILLGFDTPRRERELIILRMGWLCQSEYEFGQHTLYGREKGGLTDEEIYNVTRPLATHQWHDHERLLLEMADELYANDGLSDGTWAELELRWTTKEIMEFVFTALAYRMTGGFLNTFGVKLEEGVPGWPTPPSA
jgi:4-carboxymuconolactone decarboxylase